VYGERQARPGTARQPPTLDLLWNGAPGEIRTPDLLVRSQALYPTELRAHARKICLRIGAALQAALQLLAEREGLLGARAPRPFAPLRDRRRSHAGVSLPSDQLLQVLRLGAALQAASQLLAEREGLLGARASSLRSASGPPTRSDGVSLLSDQNSPRLWPGGSSKQLLTYWRRGRDSNPRWAFDPYTLSRGAPSTTRPPLRIGQGPQSRSAG
jgi:hypothetical protein